MRKVIFALAAASALAATPALANETRVEVRGGVIWSGGSSQDVWGGAVGYDFDLGSSAFAGAEVSGDVIGASGSKVAFGFTGRLGGKLSEKSKLYAAGGYTTEFCTACGGNWNAGVGFEQGFGKNFYGKVEYRHFFDGTFSDADAVVAGVGLKF